ncbi:hypothetical protein ACFVAE_13855 [Microbacterium sp. NPDC057659]|uniref:hypothetical protein n=1 Tax=Microbacterium sp. NPDC057659 TaxID=3346198 RepID=UPI00366F7FFA
MRMNLRRGGVVRTLAISVIAVGIAMGGVSPAQAKETAVVQQAMNIHDMAVKASGIRFNPEPYLSAAGNLRQQASVLRSSASIATKQRAVQTALRELESIRPYFRGAAATEFQRQVGFISAYGSGKLWLTTAVKLDQMASKLQEIVELYRNSEAGSVGRWP